MMWSPFLIWAAMWLAGPPLSESGNRTLVSVLAPMSYGASCWSQVELENLSHGSVVARVEGHKGSGALVAMAGAGGVAVKLAAGEKIQLQLQVSGEESLEGWVKITEMIPDFAKGPSLAVSGRTECLVNEQLVTVPQAVGFPMRNPWLEVDLSETAGRTAMVLNLSAEAASAKACYSNGTAVSRANEDGLGSKMVRVCVEERLLQVPPLASVLVPMEVDGNSHFGLETAGESLVMRVLLPLKAGVRTYSVDSTVKFGQPVEEKP